MNTSSQLDDYEHLLDPARHLFAESFAATIAELNADAQLAERFLLQFSSRAVQMTRPVEGWIRRAGQRCIEEGLTDIGASLQTHAKHEANHDRMLVADTQALLERIRARGEAAVTADQLLDRPATTAIDRYVALHEDTIASERPWGQVAIEYEIERLSIVHGTTLLDAIRTLLGDDTSKAMTFLEDHVLLDQGHTEMNARMLARVLAQRPDSLSSLATCGTQALAAYGAFLRECLELARPELHAW